MSLDVRDSWEVVQTAVCNWPLIGAVLTGVFEWWERNQWSGFVALIFGFTWLVWAVSRPVGIFWPKVSIGDTSPEGTVLFRYVPDIKQATLEINRTYAQLRRDAHSLAQTMDTIQSLVGFRGYRGIYSAAIWYLRVKLPKTTRVIEKRSDDFRQNADLFLKAHQGLIADYPKGVPVSNSVWAILWGAQAQVAWAMGLDAVLSVLGTGLQQLHDSRRMGQLDRHISDAHDAVELVRQGLEKIIQVQEVIEPLFLFAMSEAEEIAQ